MSGLKSISMRIFGLATAAGGKPCDQKARYLTSEEIEARKQRLQAGHERSLKFMPVSGRCYTAWIDESESNGLVAGVLDIPGFPTLWQPKSDLADWLLVDALNQEVQKYLDLCKKLGWPPAQRDPAAARRMTYTSTAERAAVAAARELARECATEVGDVCMGTGLASAIVAHHLNAWAPELHGTA